MKRILQLSALLISKGCLFFFEVKNLKSVDDVYSAIEDMTVRGAPLIGAAAAFGLYLATLEITSQTNIRDHLSNAARYLISCRPTAVNLSWAVNFVLEKLNKNLSSGSLSETALKAAVEICEMEKEYCRQIGIHGLKLIESLSEKRGGEPGKYPHSLQCRVACPLSITEP